MKKDHNPTSDAAALRYRAEERLKEKQRGQNSAEGAPDKAEDTLALIQELQIHQIELEMQNEEMRRAQAELEVLQARYFDLYDLAPVGYCTVSEKGLILEANLTAANLLGAVRGALVKRPISQFILPEDQDIYYRHRKQLFETGEPQSYELRIVEIDGTALWVHLEATAAQEADGASVCRIVLSDITALKRMEETLRESEKKYRELSIIDDLTRLYNPRYFHQQLRMEIDRANRYGHPLSLFLMDLDDFKAFNDAYGHVEGDHVLSRVGQVVKRKLRQTDSAYRYGGEEFTILLPMTKSTDGAVTAERIRTELKKENFSRAPGQDVHITVSIGLAQYKPPEETEAFIHRADQLMYQGKKNGKNMVCYDS
jgi:diguanylate cyclase (GGDEF)-like protein/PAS domain S-box-containing protein